MPTPCSLQTDILGMLVNLSISLRPKDFEGKPRIFKTDMSSPSGYLLAGKFDLTAGDVVFVSTAGVTSWSRFINQVLPFTDFINSAESTELIKN